MVLAFCTTQVKYAGREPIRLGNLIGWLVQKNIQTRLGQLDDVVGTRTRAIQRQLRNVETLPAVEAQIELPEIILSTDDNPEL